MEDQDRCRECGEKRPADAPGGLCSACLLQAGLAGGAPGDGNSGALARLAETLVDVPRVHLRDDEPSDSGPVVRPASAEMPDSSERLGRLQLLGEVARGGMGVIIKGRDSDLGRDLAVKVLLEQHRKNPDLIRRFVEEAQIAGQLQHPGVVPVYELAPATEDRQAFYTMRFVRGRTLAEAVRAYHRRRAAGEVGAVEFRDLLQALVGVCNAVAYAHSRGVLHRDLKPQNVVLGDYGEVIVLDWGLAKLVDRPDGAGASAVAVGDPDGRGETAVGQALGTPAYMAPEQARGEEVDERADVWAAGKALAEMLTGKLPEAGGEPAEGPLPSVAPHLARAIRAALAPDPALRPRDGGAWLDQLESARRALERRRVLRRVALLAGLGLLGGLVVTGLAIWRIGER